MEKILEDIEYDNLKKFKKRLKNDGVDLACLLPGRQTFLHYACSHGAERIIHYLLKKGLSVGDRDINGNIPLMCLCRWGKLQAVHNFLDLAIPLIKVVPLSIFFKNKQGIYPAKVIEDHFHLKDADFSQLFDQKETMNENKEEHKESKKDDWEEKLAGAAEADYDDAEGGFYSKDFHEPPSTADEPFDDWLSRMGQEYSAKQRSRSYCNHKHYGHTTRPSAANHDDSRSQEGFKRRRHHFCRDDEQCGFNQEYNTSSTGRRPPGSQSSQNGPESTGPRTEEYPKRKHYEKFNFSSWSNNSNESSHHGSKYSSRTPSSTQPCGIKKSAYLYNSKMFFDHANTDLATIDTIPWPLYTLVKSKASNKFDFSKHNITKLLFSSSDNYNEEQRKRFLRQQRCQWHPDKFSQRCHDRIVESEREEIMKNVMVISQILNALV